MQIVISFNSKVSYESIFDSNTLSLFLATYKGLSVEHELKDMIVLKEEQRTIVIDQRGSVYVEIETVNDTEDTVIQTLVSNLEQYTTIANADNRYQFPHTFNVSVSKGNAEFLKEILTNKEIQHTLFIHNEIASFTIYQKASLW